MHDDPARYWQDLTENYRRMSDGELLELAEKPEDLTEVARQVLRDEMKLRKLDKPRPAVGVPRTMNVTRKSYDALAGPLAHPNVVSSDAGSMADEADSDDDSSGEFTWKALLCDCGSADQALQLRAALMRYGIESWVTQVSAYSADVPGPQVYVAADQLEEARAIAAQPIPQDILDEWNTVVPEFELPLCPQCGTNHDVVLEDADPANLWLCETCGTEWIDPVPSPERTPDAP